MKNRHFILQLTIILVVIGCKTSTNINLNDDRDKDGIIDIYDKCPDQSGSKDLEGCRDRDSDGVPDDEDRCPDVAGPSENNGCPWPDSDGDGVLDMYDACPEIFGEDDGCPARIPIDSVGQSAKLRKFPENPPRPSDVEVVPNTYFNGARKLNEIDIKITKALNKAGYSRKSYYGVKDGFALVTQLEQTDENGRPLKEDLRWSKTVDNIDGFSLYDYIRSLLTAQTGYYRCIVFIVKKDPISFSSASASQEYMEGILDNGGTSLPDEIKEVEFSANYEVTALIYQFRKPENSSAVQLSPSPTPGKHLTNSGIRQKL